jgi:hypothetical protein
MPENITDERSPVKSLKRKNLSPPQKELEELLQRAPELEPYRDSMGLRIIALLRALSQENGIAVYIAEKDGSPEYRARSPEWITDRIAKSEPIAGIGSFITAWLSKQKWPFPAISVQPKEFLGELSDSQAFVDLADKIRRDEALGDLTFKASRALFKEAGDASLGLWASVMYGSLAATEERIIPLLPDFSGMSEAYIRSGLADEFAENGNLTASDIFKGYRQTPGRIAKKIEWLLADEPRAIPLEDGGGFREYQDSEKLKVQKYRLQALKIYGSSIDTLMRPEVTEVIDAGGELKPALCSAIGCKAEHLNIVASATGSLMDTLYGPCLGDRMAKDIAYHDIERSSWAGVKAAKDWSTTIWHQRARMNAGFDLIRPDFMRSDEARDTVRSIWNDLIEPVIDDEVMKYSLSQEEVRECFEPRHDSGSFYHFRNARTFGHDGILQNAKKRDAFSSVLKIFRTAVIGPRKLGGFKEGVDRFHAFAASMEALKHEILQKRPGWPGLLVKPWKSACGRFEIKDLTTAGALVEEGLALHHCVGGYYDQCRKGQTKILSVSRDGEKAATVEIHTRLNEKGVVDPKSLQVIQFKSAHNAKPDRELQEILRAAMGSITSGGHKIKSRDIADFQKFVQSTETAYSSNVSQATLKTADKVFPAFRDTILPGCLPGETHREWMERTGLYSAIRETVRVAVENYFPGHPVVRDASSDLPHVPRPTRLG